VNYIPPDLRDFDLCPSASRRRGLDFIRNSLEISRVEEVGVHTTVSHPCSNIDTIELPNLCMFGKSDIELVVREPAEDGRNVEPSNLWPGAMPIDECFDLPPYNAPIYSSKLHPIQQHEPGRS